MIEVIVLTSSSQGSASIQLAELVKSKKIKVKAVVLNRGLITNKKKYYKRHGIWAIKFLLMSLSLEKNNGLLLVRC